MKKFKPVLASFFILLASCGGGDSTSTTATDSTGVFLDGPVVNIGYKTETKQSVTNALGEYDYLAGESVTFFIGDLEFPKVPASGVVTPLELAGTTDTSDPTVVNMIRLLQTLDENADHSDGIQITEAAIAAATQVDFNLTVAEFEASQAVTALLTNLSIPGLISEAAAIENFETTLDENYSVNLTEITASSSISFSSCTGVLGGWDYSFTNTTMTLTGTDTWNDCNLGEDETITVDVTGFAPDFDIPFNCQDYPVCTSADFNKVITGTDDDNRSFTSTYSFDRASSTLTYVKEVESTTFTETIILQEGPGFLSLIPGTYESELDLDSFATVFVLNADNTGAWSYQEEGGSITWDVNSDGVLIITWESERFEEYTLTSGNILNGRVNVSFSDEPEDQAASWVKVALQEPAAFTEGWPEPSFLSGKTYYSVFFKDETNQYEIDVISFTSETEYSLVLYPFDTPEIGTYQIANGILHFVGLEHISVLGVDDINGGIETCWADTLNEAESCVTNTDVMFGNLAGALDYKNSLPLP